MVKHALGLAFVAALGLGSTAHAADLTVVTEDVVIAAPAFSWTGFYAGGHAGYGWADLDNDLTDAAGDGNKPDGFFGGGQVGYNYQFSNQIVLGLEADAAFADFKDDIAAAGPDGGMFTAYTKITALGTVRARAGYAIDRFLPYVTGGFAWANAKSGLDVTGLQDVPNFGVGDCQLHTGWTVGAGLEYAVTNNITAKVEYLYADLGSKEYDVEAFGPGSRLNADLSSLQTVKFGLNYKF